MSNAETDRHAPAEQHEAHPHGSLRGYVTGFLLAALLTVIPFWLVMGEVFDNRTVTALTIMAFAAMQIVVHMVFFLHMNPRSEGGWTLLALAFTIIIVVITLAGSLWVMYHLNSDMLPAPHEMSQAP